MTLLAAYSLDEGTGTTAADATGNGHTLTLANATWDASGHTNAALTNTAADTGASGTVPAITTAAVTLMAWVKPLNLAAGTSHFVCGMMQGSGSTDLALWTQRGDFGTSNVLQANVRIGGNLTACNGTSALTVGTWAHVAVTYDGSNIRLYRNAVLETTVAVTGSVSFSTAFYVAGALAAAGADSDVVVDDPRLYNEVLDGTAINTAMNTPVTGASTVTGTGSAALGALSGTSAGTRTVLATAAATLGALAATATGSRTVLATAQAVLGALAGTASGTPTTPPRGTALLGALNATALGQRIVAGVALASLGGLQGTAIVESPGGAMVEEGSWYQLLAIYQDAAQEYALEKARVPVACPNDGEPLTEGPDGRLFCKFDGWRPPN